jgi:glycosyltransferase involved in cell wall biosynthesis
VWNAAATLPTCLRSIQRQTEPHWQCVIVDDGSQDDSLAWAYRFAERDCRFTVIARAHQGLVATLNAGLAYCRGPFVARMDADDVMHRTRLAVQIQALVTQPVLAAVGCHVRVFPRLRLSEGRRAYERWLNSMDRAEQIRQDAFVECPIAHPTLCIRRQPLVDLGYRDCGWPEDYDLILRLLTQGHALGIVPRRLLSWRDGPQRLSRTSSMYTLERFTACKAAFLAAHFLAAADRYILWGYGHTGKALRRALLVHGKVPSHIVEVHPGRLDNRIHNAPVVSPEALLHMPRRPVIVSVAGAVARQTIRQAMAHMGFVETVDYVCAA